jgi:hypothetical protein
MLSRYIRSDTPGNLVSGPCMLAGLVVSDSAAGSFNLFDNLAGATNPVFDINFASSGTIAIMFPSPVIFTTGLTWDNPAGDAPIITVLLV